jgi:antitoxin HicB
MNEDHVAEQLAEAMETQGITKLEMAAHMKTSRRQLDRLFDPSIPSVTLDTFRRAANAVGLVASHRIGVTLGRSRKHR